MLRAKEKEQLVLPGTMMTTPHEKGKERMQNSTCESKQSVLVSTKGCHETKKIARASEVMQSKIV